MKMRVQGCNRRYLLSNSLALIALLFLQLCLADVYMHVPRGSNNRLNENGRERNNANRLFNSQNNNRGGYNVNTNPNADTTTNFPAQQYYYENTIVNVEWTSQHSCSNPNANCVYVIQYMCDQTEAMRDGATTNTIPDPRNNNGCANQNCDTDPTFGRHESAAYWNRTKWTDANRGLFHADQQLNGNNARPSSRYTRTNPNGAQYGYESAEERDYYPYWLPSPWKDVAVITNQPSRCAAYQTLSQNVQPRYQCEFDTLTSQQQQSQNNDQAYIPIIQTACETAGGRWTLVPAWNIPPPACVTNFAYSRDNHLGNPVKDGYPYYYNWTVPNDYSERCTLRLRYNISTADFTMPGSSLSTDPTDGGFASPSSIQAGIDYTFNANNGDTVTKVPIWTKYGLNQTEVATPTTNRPYSRGYVYSGNGGPLVDPFGPLLWSGSTPPNVASVVRLRLAFDTTQFFRIFQDRAHTFGIRQRPDILKNVKIHNVGVRGKRGNIVQTYPGVEYDFVPDRLHLKEGEFVHFQWAGSETNNDGNDRSNVILQGYSAYNYVVRNRTDGTILTNPAKSLTYGDLSRAYPCRIDDPVKCPFLGFSFWDKQRLALNGLNSTYFDLGPRQVTGVGIYNYMSTRNNAFTNRDHKATIIVEANNASWTTIPWGPDAPQATIMDGAWLDNGQDTGLAVANEDVWVQSLGQSGFNSDWFQVNPYTLTIQNGRQLYLNIPYTSSPLNDVVVWWKKNATTQDLIQVPNASQSGSSVRIPITIGGMYVVQNQVNASAVAGIVLGVFFVLAICFFLYWKVRVQPLGGWKNWLRENKKPHLIERQNVPADDPVQQLLMKKEPPKISTIV